MADISIIHEGNTDYNVKDVAGRLALAEVENKGAKNRLPLTGESTDIFTINEDGTMTANGSSSTSKRDFAYYIGAPPKGRFVFSGCPPTGSNTTYRMFLQSVVESTYTTLATLTGDPVEVDLTNIDKIRVLISIYAGYTPNNIKFSPMLCTKEEWDISQAYVPYGKTNAELTAENTSQQSEIDYAINTGTKNILTPTLTSESTKEGITCTPNPDGTFTLNGTFPATSSQTNTYFVAVNNAKLKELSDKYGATDVICSGGSDIERSQGRLRFYKIDINEDTYDSSATDKEKSLTLSDNISSSANISIVVYRGQTLNNVVIKPMIRPAAITDDTFVPYAKTNRELTVENDSQQSEIDYAVNAGVKNLLDYTFSINGDTSARTANGVTFTINADRSITTSGTATANVTSAWVQRNYVVPIEPVILSGCPAGGAYNKYKVDILDGTQTGSIVASDYGNGVVIKSSMFTNGIGLIRIRIENGQNVDGLVFKPMIRSASIADPTYEPYAPTNRELFEEKIDHDLPEVSGSILDYADTLAQGIYFARQRSSVGSGKPVSNRRYVYNIYVYSSATASIMAIEGEDPSNPRMYLTNKISGTWSSWYKFEGTQVT